MFIFLTSACLCERLVTLVEKCCAWLSESVDKLNNCRRYGNGDLLPNFLLHVFFSPPALKGSTMCM